MTSRTFMKRWRGMVWIRKGLNEIGRKTERGRQRVLKDVAYFLEI